MHGDACKDAAKLDLAMRRLDEVSSNAFANGVCRVRIDQDFARRLGTKPGACEPHSSRNTCRFVGKDER